MAAAGVAQANRELVGDEAAATGGEDGRTAGKTCPLLLATVGGEPSDETVVWQYAPADRRAVASGGIAEAVGAGKSIQSQEGTEGCLTKADGKAATSRAISRGSKACTTSTPSMRSRSGKLWPLLPASAKPGWSRCWSPCCGSFRFASAAFTPITAASSSTRAWASCSTSCSS